MEDGKLWYQSKTFYGGLLVGIEAGIILYSQTGDILQGILAGLGSWLTIFGLRDAIAKIKKK